MADDAHLLEMVFLTEALHLVVDQLGKLFNASCVECIKDTAQIKAEDAESILAKASFQDAKNPPGCPKSIKEENRMIARLEIGQPFDLISFKGHPEVGDCLIDILTRLADIFFYLFNRHTKKIKEIMALVN